MSGKLKNIDIEDYWNIINYNYNQIQFAEVKATAVISIYSLIFGLGYTLDILDEENIYSFTLGFAGAVHILLLGVSFFFIIASLRRCVMCILPRFNFSVKKSPLFFGDVTKYKDFDVFFDSLEEVLNDENTYRKHLTQSVYATANIASTKFLNVNKGLKHLLKSLIFITLFFISIYAI
ncbi:MAG: hypothetical protein CMC63_03150 [Flavobacteriaceae bacterium]|nr:hypothetical protein [Flavobacteriaceae bacterium]|tara:strand:- start:132 stop:665 length:534 start_codon:yes stop_codon:yes gene_type:complete